MTALALHSYDIVYYQRFHAAGFYIGYPNKEKHRVWVSGVVQSDLNEIDKLGTDYNGLATDLLELLFKREMLTPDNYCCTQSKGKMLLNQELLRGIRRKLKNISVLSRRLLGWKWA